MSNQIFKVSISNLSDEIINLNPEEAEKIFGGLRKEENCVEPGMCGTGWWWYWEPGMSVMDGW
jgi:hypothetical protein